MQECPRNCHGYTFPVTIQSLFEGQSTGTLKTTKLITDTVIIQFFKSFFILEIYSILFLWNSSLVILSMTLGKQTAFSK